MSVPDALRRHAAASPLREAFADETGRLTYGAADGLVDAVCARLAARGICAGDRVALLAAPSIGFAILCLGILRFGAVFVGLNPRHTDRELAQAIAVARPAIVFAEAEAGLDAIGSAVARSAPQAAILPYRRLGDLLAGLPPASAGRPFAHHPSPDQPAAFVFTSGSSGTPKAAVLSHLGISFACALQVGGLSPRQPRTLNNFPISHVSGLVNGLLAPVWDGGFVCFQARFDPACVLQAIREERLTLLLQIPTMLQDLVRHPDWRALERLHTVSWGGGRLPAPIVERLRSLDVRLCTQYGMTETTNVFTFVDAGERDPRVLANTVGRPHPAVEFRIVPAGGAGGKGAPPVEGSGEIQVRGPLLMLGYFEQPEASRAAFTEDGWLRTGDIGRLRPDGNLEICGRLREVFKSGGYNVLPREIEEVLERHEGVGLAAVVPVPSDQYGEVGIAFVQPVTDATAPALDAADLRGWCRLHLANYKVPKAIAILLALPLLPTGKVDRAELSSRAASLLHADAR